MIILLFSLLHKILRQVTQNIKNVDTSIATSEANTHKNRYKDKIPCKQTCIHNTHTHNVMFAFNISDNHNRVCFRSAVQGSDYINASFVDVRKNRVYSAINPLPNVN